MPIPDCKKSDGFLDNAYGRHRLARTQRRHAPLVGRPHPRMAKSTQDPHKRRAAYLSERRALIESEQKSSEQFDKGILTLAAGALAVSLVFLEKIAPKPPHHSVAALYIAWVALIASLLSTLASFLTSQHACRRAVHILESPEPAAETNWWPELQ